jgi:hypothetical protein
MVAKPSAKTILNEYSLDELIDLVKEKAQMEVDAKLNEAKSQLMALFSESSPSSSPAKAPSAGTTRKKSTSVKTAKPGRGKMKKVPLTELIVQVLDSTPKKIADILTEVKTLGYKTKSKNPKSIISQELLRLVNKGVAIKEDRGMYILK